MTVRINKPAINLREKLAELDKPSGLTGEELLRSQTSEEARNSLDLEEHLFENFESTGIDDNATSTKVTVSDSGVDVTGTVTADGLELGANDKVQFGTSDSTGLYRTNSGSDLTLQHWGNVSVLIDSDNNDSDTRAFVIGANSQDTSTAENIAKFSENGDISFYEDTGTTAKFHWDASAERLTIDGTNTPLNIKSPTQSIIGGGSQVKIGSTDTAAAGKGGQLNFTANTVSLANYPVAGVHGYHETAGVGNYSGYLSMYTTSSGGGITERMRIDSSGFVGIATNNPAERLHIDTASTTNKIRLSTDNGNKFANIYSDINGVMILDANANGAGAAGRLGFNVSGTERARIDSSGNLLVGTTSATTNCKLKVQGAAQLSGEVTYTKLYTLIDTTGRAVAGLTTGYNGNSAVFEFTGTAGSGSGAGFSILFHCHNIEGTWSVNKDEIVTSTNVDIEYSGGVFTFKAKSGTHYYSPRVKVKCFGNYLDTSYFN